jgi:hypothetical protein
MIAVEMGISMLQLATLFGSMSKHFRFSVASRELKRANNAAVYLLLQHIPALWDVCATAPRLSSLDYNRPVAVPWSILSCISAHKLLASGSHLSNLQNLFCSSIATSV